MSEGINENTDKASQEIDLWEITKKLWTQRRFIFKWVGIAAVVGLVVGFSIPSEYTVSVKMVAETNEQKTSTSGVSQLASLAGINLGGPGSGYGIGVLMYPIPGRYAHRAGTTPKGEGTLYPVRLSVGASKNGLVESRHRFSLPCVGMDRIAVFGE